MRSSSVFYFALVLVCSSYGYPQRTVQRAPIDQEAEPTQNEDDTDMYMEPIEKDKSDVNQDSQNFYPSYTSYNDQPLGHSRPFYYQPDAAYSHRPTAYQQHVGFESARISGYKGDYFEDRSPNENSILGSGNFGVIKGGTFYNDKDSDEYDYDGGYSFYHNGHGRPSFNYGNNRRPTQQEQFENFRDFADINTPSYSHFVVVYANKNGTKPNNVERPKNILEHLAMLDLENYTPTEKSIPDIVTPTKKLSKSKVKLAKLFVGKKKPKQKLSTQSNKDLYEPLLALS